MSNKKSAKKRKKSKKNKIRTIFHSIETIILGTLIVLFSLIAAVYLINISYEQVNIDGDNTQSLTYVGGLYGSGFPNYLDGVQELKIHDDYIYVSSALDHRVTILSVVNSKSNPVFVSSINVNAVPRKLSISQDGNWLFLGTQISEDFGSGNLTVINVTDKANPTILTEMVIDPEGSIIGCSYIESKEVCYLTSYEENRLYSIDVSNKKNPSVISYISVGDGPHGVWANETIGFVLGHHDKTVYTFDVSNPKNMIQLCNISAPALDGCSQLYDQYVPIIYVASLYNSVLVFNISNPNNIQVSMGMEFESGITCSIVPNAEETVIYVTKATSDTHDGKLEVYQITNKLIDPNIYDSISDSETVPLGQPTAGALGVIDNYIYVGLWDDDGISVFKFGNE